MEKKRKITISGISKLKVLTDYIRISFVMKSSGKTYNLAFEALAAQANKLKTILNKNELNEGLKTSEFSINKITKFNEKIKEYCFVAYEATQEWFISLEVNNNKLNELLNDISISIKDLDFNISYFCNNPNRYENELIELAIKDSIDKANLICNSTGLKLGLILNINYSYSVIHIENEIEYSLQGNEMCTISDCISMPDVLPEDTELQKKIDIVWEII